MTPTDESAWRDGGRPVPPPRGFDPPQRWARVKSVFAEALDRPESDREMWLAHACAGDPELHAEVASLLASARAAGDFCETPAAGLLQIGEPDDAAGLLQLGEFDDASEPPLPPGTVLGAYEITGFLSAGGMGEVYRARHTVLGRDVAIKTVRAHLSDGDSRRRLLREARHAARLSHPSICTIHEVGEHDGQPFIVMALIEGSPLRELIRSAPPPLERALDYAVQVADALAHAHGCGIVHRDLKSSNVMVDAAGRAVVLDFGLARRLPHAGGGPAADATLTAAGALAGTVSHMAPEVLLGGAADARSDIWSLGVLLYELATGSLPFHGRTPFETSAVILSEPAPPLPGRVPLALRLVIERCLAKNPNDRYASAVEVRAALDAIRRRRAWPLVSRLLLSTRRRALTGVAAVLLVVAGAAAAAPQLRERLGGRLGEVSTLAVLPIENATADPDIEYYAAGLTHALTTQFGEAAAVRLIAAASAARAARDEGTPAGVARALGADAVVAARLRRAGDRIAVDVRILEPARGRVLWSDTFERNAGQVLALQADVVRAIAAEIRLTLRPGSGERLATTRAVTPEAYEEYLKGRVEWSRRSQASLERAVAHFLRSIELDPTYAPAHAALADCYNQFGTVLVGAGSPSDFRPRAAAAAIRALQIDPSSAEAHATLAYTRHYDWQWAEAERGFRRALELNPNYALARIWYANLLMSSGRMEEALAQVDAARELDPYSLVVNTNVAWVLYYARRYEDAIAQLTHTLALDSTYSQARMRLIDALLGAGRHAEAHAHAERLIALTGRWPPALAALAGVHARSGRPDSARALLAELLELEKSTHVAKAAIASVHVQLGDIDGALPWYVRTLEERSNASVYLMLEPALAALRTDPRFLDMLDRAGVH